METTNKQYPKLGHEKFEAYQISIQFLVLSFKVTKAIPPGNHHLLDQLKRAALSIPLNIAEGSGKMTEGEKKRFYSIARGSTMERAAILDVLAVMEVISNDNLYDGKSKLSSIAGILTKVCRN